MYGKRMSTGSFVTMAVVAKKKIAVRQQSRTKRGGAAETSRTIQHKEKLRGEKETG